MTTYTPIPAVSNDDEISAAWWNTYIKNNFAAVVEDCFTTKGDMSFASAADANTKLATGSDTQLVEAASGQANGTAASWAFVPIGGIIMWAGVIGNIPANWQLCNGTNGTPDLQNSFVIGAGDTYAVDATGGSDTINIQHNHTGTVTDADVGHTHTQAVTGAGASHTHSGTTGVESATNDVQVTTGVDAAINNHTHLSDIVTAAEAAHTHVNPNTNAASPTTHTHGITADNQLSAAQDIRPPYYGIYYIQRLT